jgi:hypothetical protein
MKIVRSILATAAAMLLLATASQAIAAMYKWVDEDGNVHYSQQPPPGASRERVAPPPPPPTGAGAPSERLQQQLDALDERKAQEQEAASERAERTLSAAERSARCQQARNTLATLQSRGRVRMRDAQGVYTRLDETERQAAIERAQQQIAEFCD